MFFSKLKKHPLSKIDTSREFNILNRLGVAGDPLLIIPILDKGLEGQDYIVCGAEQISSHGQRYMPRRSISHSDLAVLVKIRVQEGYEIFQNNAYMNNCSLSEAEVAAFVEKLKPHSVGTPLTNILDCDCENKPVFASKTRLDSYAIYPVHKDGVLLDTFEFSKSDGNNYMPYRSVKKEHLLDLLYELESKGYVISQL